MVQNNETDPVFGTQLFAHRLAFVLSRAFAIPTIPLVWLIAGGMIHENFVDPFGWMLLVGGLVAAVTPIFIFKFIVRLTCPNCKKSKMDREIMGAGNYECKECGYTSS